jgi:outer membrane lipoprotein LolB
MRWFNALSKRLGRIGLSCLPWLLAACASGFPNLQSDDAALQIQLMQLPSWSGRLALRIEAAPVQNHSAGFMLRGNAQLGQLSLLSPIGTTVYFMEWTPTQAKLHANGQIYTAADVVALSEVATGTAIPVADVFEWLRGQPNQNAHWQVDSSQSDSGRWTAVREHPAPRTVLRIILDRA